jgi:hypothetical protein
MTEISQSKKNEIAIVKLEGEINLLHHKIDTIKNNHLAHIDQKINLIYKFIWLILGTGMASVANLVVTLLVK